MRNMLSNPASYDEIEKEIEKMHSANPKIREESIVSLYKISKEIGVPYTIQYLVPFIKTILDTNEESKIPILAQTERIAKEILKEIDPVYSIYKEIFLTRNEITREKATESLVSAISEVDSTEGNFIGLEGFICSMGESRFIMHRISAIALMKRLLTGMPQGKGLKRLENLFEKLQHDSMPIVRRTSIKSVEISKYFYSEDKIRKVIERVLEDNDDTVRSCFIELLLILPKSEDNAYFNLEVFKKGSVDSSWRVRSSSTQIIRDVAVYAYSAYGKNAMYNRQKTHRTHTDTQVKDTDDSDQPEIDIGIDVLECIDRLVDDKEEAVRRSIVEKTPEILSEAPKTKCKILYIIDKAASDVSAEVRESVPKVLSKISESLSKEDVEMYVSPIIRRLLVDEDRKTKMETISRLKTLYSKLGPTAIGNALSPVINDLESSNWRTRTAVLKIISSLSRQMEITYFYEYLKDPFFKMFVDPIWLVRKEAASILGEISINFGAEWICKDMISSLSFLKKSTNYSHRISYVTGIGQVLLTLWPRPVQKMLSSELSDLSKDPVPQVRMTVAKAVRKGHLEDKEEILKVLQGDSHPEVVNACVEG